MLSQQASSCASGAVNAHEMVAGRSRAAASALGNGNTPLNNAVCCNQDTGCGVKTCFVDGRLYPKPLYPNRLMSVWTVPGSLSPYGRDMQRVCWLFVRRAIRVHGEVSRAKHRAETGKFLMTGADMGSSVFKTALPWHRGPGAAWTESSPGRFAARTLQNEDARALLLLGCLEGL